MIPVIARAIPMFAVFAAFGMLDSVWALILAHTASKLPVAIWLLMGFIQDVPREVEEAAQVDGAGVVRTLATIVTPLIWPGVGATAVITFLFTWNDLLLALTLTSSKAAQTLPVGLTNFISQYGIDWGGLSECRKIANMAEIYYVPFAPHNVSSPIGTMASAHVCATVPNFLVLEFHWMHRDSWATITDGGDIIKDGYIALNDRPGIGLELNEEVAKAHQYPGTTWFA